MVYSLNPKFVSAFHIVVVAPLLILVGLDKFPEKYKKIFVVLGAIVLLYHSWRLYKLMSHDGSIRHMTENMAGSVSEINGMNIHHIRMYDSSPGYENPVVQIKAGDVVVWSNVGEVEHTVTAVDESFDSGYMKPGERFSVRFVNKGSYDYYSVPQLGWMIGKIIVN